MCRATQPLKRTDDTLIIIRCRYKAGLPFYFVGRVTHRDANPGGDKHTNIILLITYRNYRIGRYIRLMNYFTDSIAFINFAMLNVNIIIAGDDSTEFVRKLIV